MGKAKTDNIRATSEYADGSSRPDSSVLIEWRLSGYRRDGTITGGNSATKKWAPDRSGLLAFTDPSADGFHLIWMGSCMIRFTDESD